MNEHWNDEAVARYIDGEKTDGGHLHDCTACSKRVIAAMQWKRAVREAMPRYEVPKRLRDRVDARVDRRRTTWWMVAAAMIALVIAGQAFMMTSRRSATRELVDLHATIVGSASPIDVVSADRHTVKPWFEGRVPFAVSVPELAGTPFHLAGGRVVYWRGNPGAYMLITKGAHKVSLFEFDEEAASNPGPVDSMTVVSWRAKGLRCIAVGDLSRAELESIRSKT